MSEVISVAPGELSIDQLTSGQEFIKGRRVVEILPDSQSSYGSGSGNYRATFNVGSSGNEFLDSLNSYFKCDLTVTTTANATYTVRSHLDEGGIHSLIKSITIQTRNGVRIEHIDNYNKLYSMLRNATMSSNHVNSVSSFECGDSMAFRPFLDPNAVYTDTAVIIPTDDSELNTTPIIPTGAVSVAALETVINSAIRASAVRLYEPARRKFANGSASACSFKLLSDFLSHIKYIPLPMLQQLQIIFEFERPSLGLFNTKRLTADGVPLKGIVDGDITNYSIDKFRYCANMVEVSENTLNEYNKVYETDGISLPFQSYRTFRYGLSSTGGNFEVQFGANSVRYALLAIMNNHSFTEGNQAKSYRSNSMFLKDTMKSYSFRSGGKVYPANSPIDVSTQYGSEAFTQLMIALNQHQNTLMDTSMRVYEWDAANVTTISGVEPEANVSAPLAITDATKFMLGVDLTDINNFSGLNTVGNNLVADLTFTAAPGANGRNAFVVLCFDSVLTLSKKMGTIVRY